MKLEELMVAKIVAKVNVSDTVGLEDCTGFWVEINMLSKKERVDMFKRCTKTTVNPKTRVKEEKLDEALYNAEFARAVVTNWGGLKLDYLQLLLPIDTADKDLQEELEYSEENALLLLDNSPLFNAWLIDALDDSENFRARSDGKVENSTGEISN